MPAGNSDRGAKTEVEDVVQRVDVDNTEQMPLAAESRRHQSNEACECVVTPKARMNTMDGFEPARATTVKPTPVSR
jgi:hypothetical protein